MQIEVHGRNLPVTPPLREYVGKRFQRLDRLFTRECTCDVELSVEARALLQRRIARRSDVLSPADTARPGLAKSESAARKQRRI